MFEVKSSIRVHARSLDEWLILVTRVSWCSFNTKYSFNRFFSKNWIAKTISNVREFLFISPFNLVFFTSVMIVMCGGSSLFQ